MCSKRNGVLDGLKDYMKDMPAYNPKFFRVATPKDPFFPATTSTA
jgi:glutaconyl-CoA decarboxylase